MKIYFNFHDNELKLRGIVSWYIYLAGKFCFPNTGHVIILQRTVPFKFRLIQVHMYICTYVIYEKAKAKSSWDLYWENKTYKLKRSIGHCHVQAIGV